MTRRWQGKDYYAKGASAANDADARAAELWFAQVYDLTPPGEYGKPDGGVDFVVGGDGQRKLRPLTLDLKWSRHARAHLIYPAAKPMAALAYVLVVGPINALHVAGYAWRRQLRDAPVRDWDGVPCRTLTQAELHPPAAVAMLVAAALGGAA